MVSLFDILGPVTVGPSSSHTAGAVRLGLVCRSILGEAVRSADITFYGSFAETYRGHGTDKAIIGGLLGLEPKDEAIRQSLAEAHAQGLDYGIDTKEDPRLHPNTVCIHARGATREITITGASVGGGAIVLTGINGFGVNVPCKGDTMVIFHRDTQGFLADVTYHLSIAGINISNLTLSRARRDGAVVTVVETDTTVSKGTLDILKQVGTVSDIIIIPQF